MGGGNLDLKPAFEDGSCHCEECKCKALSVEKPQIDLYRSHLHFGAEKNFDSTAKSTYQGHTVPKTPINQELKKSVLSSHFNIGGNTGEYSTTQQTAFSNRPSTTTYSK